MVDQHLGGLLGTSPWLRVIQRRRERTGALVQHRKLITELSWILGSGSAGQLGEPVGETEFGSADDVLNPWHGSGRLDGRVVEGTTPERLAGRDMAVESGKQTLARLAEYLPTMTA